LTKKEQITISKVIYSLEVFFLLTKFTEVIDHSMKRGRIRENGHPRIFTTLSIECPLKMMSH